MITPNQINPDKLAAYIRTDYCLCGEFNKWAGRVFCVRCTSQVPSSLRCLLFNDVGDGLEEAFVEVCRHHNFKIPTYMIKPEEK